MDLLYPALAFLTLCNVPFSAKSRIECFWAFLLQRTQISQSTAKKKKVPLGISDPNGQDVGPGWDRLGLTWPASSPSHPTQGPANAFLKNGAGESNWGKQFFRTDNRVLPL